MKNKERNSNRERQPQQEIRRRKSGHRCRRIEEQEFVLEEREQAKVEGDPDRQPNRWCAENPRIRNR